MRTVKESSDDLLPSVEGAIPAYVDAPPPPRSVLDYVALGVATCGIGFVPIAPGMWGSLLGLGFYVLISDVSLSGHAYVTMHNSALPLESFRLAVMLGVIFFTTTVGVWAATRVEPLLGRKDPQVVVIDEVAGQLVTFLFIPFNFGFGWLVAGFILFRAFDMWKPYPISRLEFLKSGLGVVADDILAGVYAGALLLLLLLIYNLL